MTLSSILCFILIQNYTFGLSGSLPGSINMNLAFKWNQVEQR
jgi:hypothetical protein